MAAFATPPKNCARRAEHARSRDKRARTHTCASNLFHEQHAPAFFVWPRTARVLRGLAAAICPRGGAVPRRCRGHGGRRSVRTDASAGAAACTAMLHAAARAAVRRMVCAAAATVVTLLSPLTAVPCAASRTSPAHLCSEFNALRSGCARTHSARFSIHPRASLSDVASHALPPPPPPVPAAAAAAAACGKRPCSSRACDATCRGGTSAFRA